MLTHSLFKELDKLKAENESLKRDQRNAQDKFEQSLKRQVEFKDSELQVSLSVLCSARRYFAESFVLLG